MGIIDETYRRVHSALCQLAREARPVEQYIIRVSPEHYADLMMERPDGRAIVSVDLVSFGGAQLAGIPIERDVRLEGDEIRLVHEIPA